MTQTDLQIPTRHLTRRSRVGYAVTAYWLGNPPRADFPDRPADYGTLRQAHEAYLALRAKTGSDVALALWHRGRRVQFNMTDVEYLTQGYLYSIVIT